MQRKLPAKCLTENIRQSKTLANLSFWYMLVCVRCPQVCAHFNQVVLNQLAGRKKHTARLPLLLWEDMRLLWCESCSCSQHKSLTYLIRASVILRNCNKIISQEQSWLSRKRHHTLPFKMFLVEGSKRGRKDNIWLKLRLHFRKGMVCWNNDNKNNKYKTPRTSFLPVLDVHHVSTMFHRHLLKFHVSFLSDPSSKLKSDSVSFSRNVARPRDRSGTGLRPEKSCHQNRKKPKQIWQRHTTG